MLEPTIGAGSGLSRHNQALAAVSLPSKPHWQHVHLPSVRQPSSGVAAHGHRVHDFSSALVQLWVLLRGPKALRSSLRGHCPSLALQHSTSQT